MEKGHMRQQSRNLQYEASEAAKRQQNRQYEAAEAAKRQQNQQNQVADTTKGIRLSKILQNARKMKENKVERQLGKGVARRLARPGPAEPARPSKGILPYSALLLYLQLIEHPSHSAQALRGVPNSSATRIPPGQKTQKKKTKKKNQSWTSGRGNSSPECAIYPQRVRQTKEKRFEAQGLGGL